MNAISSVRSYASEAGAVHDARRGGFRVSTDRHGVVYAVRGGFVVRLVVRNYGTSFEWVQS